ncbi:MAG: ribbon-helix-helix domain-containing protein [Candidatus Hydrothermarchaeota archaeon]
MERVTIRLPKQQIDRIDVLVLAGEYPSKSEVVRAAIRELLTKYNITAQEAAF